MSRLSYLPLIDEQMVESFLHKNNLQGDLKAHSLQKHKHATFSIGLENIEKNIHVLPSLLPRVEIADCWFSSISPTAHLHVIFIISLLAYISGVLPLLSFNNASMMRKTQRCQPEHFWKVTPIRSTCLLSLSAEWVCLTLRVEETLHCSLLGMKVWNVSGCASRKSLPQVIPQVWNCKWALCDQICEIYPPALSWHSLAFFLVPFILHCTYKANIAIK